MPMFTDTVFRYLKLGIALQLAASVPALADVPAGVPPELVQSTRSMAGELTTRLGQMLKATLSTEGPVAAVGVCKEMAPAIATSLSEQHGARVGRVGTRARNTATGTPNDWQKAALTDFESRLSAGENPANIEHWSVADTGKGQRELRYAKAIVMQPLCVSCHGKAEDIPAPLAEKIRADYPGDQATGYPVGKLRGAVVVVRPLPTGKP
jgi:hypothetical protein